MVFENGENWEPIDPELRGRHKTIETAFEAAFRELTTVKDPFFHSVCENWKDLFPKLPARPGRSENGKIYIYVKNSPTSFVVRPQLRRIAARLATLPGAPKQIDLRLEQHVLT